MSTADDSKFTLALSACIIAAFGVLGHAQQGQYPKPGELPNPYRLVEGCRRFPPA